jgi:hypothetical protein
MPKGCCLPGTWVMSPIFREAPSCSSHSPSWKPSLQIWSVLLTRVQSCTYNDVLRLVPQDYNGAKIFLLPSDLVAVIPL